MNPWFWGGAEACGWTGSLSQSLRPDTFYFVHGNANSSRSKLPMKSIVVVGAQWGDEGKGKVVDYLAASFDYIARCAGGHNAGHTVIFNGNRFVLQLIPCGILRPGKHAVIGSGVVVDPAALVGELDALAKCGIDLAARLHLPTR